MLEATTEQQAQINVLIVDDSKLARVHLAKLLESEKMKCAMAESAEDMLHYLQEERPDVIFLDHNMPGMSGLAALKIIKANPSTAIIPVMMYTSESDEVYLGKARALGAFDVLVKEELEPVKLAKRLMELNLRPKPPASVHPLKVKVDNTQEIDARDFFSPRERLAQNNARMMQQLHEERWKGKPVEDADDFSNEFNQETLLDEPAPAVNRRLPIGESAKSVTSLQVFLVPLAVFLGGILLALGLFNYFVSPISFGGKENIAVAPKPISDETATRIEPQPDRQPAPQTESASVVVPEPLPATVVTPVQPAPVAAATNNTSDIQVDGLLNALSWAMRAGMTYTYSELPLAGDRLKQLQTLLNYLNSAGFKGEVQLQVFSGRFCLSPAAGGTRVKPANGTPISSCEFTAVRLQPNLQDLQSRDFSRFLKTSPLANGQVGIEVNIKAIPESRNPFPYPRVTDITYAAQWNEIATQNNMVLVQLVRRP